MQVLNLDPDRCLPDDGCAGTLLARVWTTDGPVPGPSVAVVREGGVFDLSAHVATMSELLEQPDAVARVRAMPGRRIGSLAELLHHSATSAQGTVTGPPPRLSGLSVLTISPNVTPSPLMRPGILGLAIT